jgi:pyruvate formate lyase activating enzyme
MNEISGMIFDVQRSSLMDGPGIRTTIFLKGCPLRCQWCHNPESQSQRPVLAFRADKCLACKTCSTACSRGVHRFVGDQHVLHRKLCETRGDCVASCPGQALSILGRRVTVNELINLVERDRPFYEASDGGMTLSGGEPLFQPSFALALLRAAKDRCISTCVETCGYLPSSVLEEAMPLTDLFLYDVKALDPIAHRAFTGRDNLRILGNLRHLMASGAAVKLRCPLIPGWNDSKEQLDALANLIDSVPGLQGVDVLPYHDTGRTKYTRIGRPEPRIPSRTRDENAALAWAMALRTRVSPMEILLAA